MILPLITLQHLIVRQSNRDFIIEVPHETEITTTYFSLQYFYHHRNALDIGAVLREAYRLMECTPSEVDPKSNMKVFAPIPISETYPIFNKYPKFIVDYQAQEKERIRQDELDYLKERSVVQNHS